MIRHYIILNSSNPNGMRIAFHDSVIEAEEAATMLESFQQIKEECGGRRAISTHYIVTDSDSWESVYQKDNFFKGIQLVNKTDEFMELVSEN